MATIWKELKVDVAADAAWNAIRDFSGAHRLFAGVVTATRMEPGGRVVTFADGSEVREPLVAVDDEHRRLAWTVTGGPLTHHAASLQVVPDGDGSRIVWITDILPDAAQPAIAGIVEHGAGALQRFFYQQSKQKNGSSPGSQT